MSSSRGQVSTLIVGAVAFSVVLSVLVGGGLSLTGTTTDFNLEQNGNQDVPTETPTPETPTPEPPTPTPEPPETPTPEPPTPTPEPEGPAISYVAVCFEGEPPEDFDLDSIEISFSDEREDGEFFATSFTYDGDLTPAFVIIKGGQIQEQFPLQGAFVFGEGFPVEPTTPNSAPCGEGFWGVKQEEGGEEELVFRPNGGPNGPGNGNGVIALG